MDTVYTFKSGDTLSDIAKKYHTTPSIIARDNNLISPPHPGMRLLLRAQGILHYVKPFEKLSSIAKMYNVSLSHIVDTNHLSGTDLFVGQILSIPKEHL